MPITDRRFRATVHLNLAERRALDFLAEVERLPKAQVLRRLIWQAARDAAREPGNDEQAPA